MIGKSAGPNYQQLACCPAFCLLANSTQTLEVAERRAQCVLLVTTFQALALHASAFICATPNTTELLFPPQGG